ncbi:MAG: ArsB/NhaD family transporter [Actinomycetota bacterium]|nr:ArsB/NhaD family transporter [Actinomycetota bacterium]
MGAIILLTGGARRHGLAPEMLAFQPALLACLASNPLPVSNLTNLIVAERFDLGVGDFLRHLALPTLVACVVGWLGFRRTFHLHPTLDGVDEPVDARALRRGLPIVGFVLAGFTVGDLIGVPGWAVAAIAVVWAMAVVREVPWRCVPAEAMLVAAALAVLVAGAVPHLGLEQLLRGSGLGGEVRALLFGVVGSNLANNLPAVLAGSAALHEPGQVWPLLIGVNMGPTLVLTGALSGLLWRDTAAGMGVHVGARRYTAVGLRVGLPALVAAALVVLFV